MPFHRLCWGVALAALAAVPFAARAGTVPGVRAAAAVAMAALALSWWLGRRPRS